MDTNVSFQDVLGHVGRNDAGGYHDGRYGVHSDAKQAERERVLEFILGHVDDGNHRIKMLSFPGLSWSFENMLLARRPDSSLLCLENSVSIYHRAKRFIPGIRNAEDSELYRLQERTFQFGRAEVSYSRVTMHTRKASPSTQRHPIWGGYRGTGAKAWRSNRFVLMNAETYMTMLTSDFGQDAHQRKQWHAKFYNRSAVWLDFTSQLCSSTETTIQNLHFCMSCDSDPKPVAITLLNCRDSYKGVKARLGRIQELQPRLAIQDHWTYAGKSGAPMLTVCATII